MHSHEGLAVYTVFRVHLQLEFVIEVMPLTEPRIANVSHSRGSTQWPPVQDSAI